MEDCYFRVAYSGKNWASNWSKIVKYDGQASSSIISDISNSISAEADIPVEYRLYQNYPNPFNPSTTIRVDLPESDHLRILIYDLQGRLVRRLFDDFLKAGSHQMVWDAKGNDGQILASGIYLIVMETPKFRAMEKCLFLK